MEPRQIRHALISVFYKDGLAPLVHRLHDLGVKLISTGGTQDFIEKLGVPVYPVESLTDFPEILDGRVKTLHPKVFGGILARREPAHLSQLERFAIPPIDLVIVDLYPFEETLRNTSDESAIIEKIDIGGISLIRAAAKNYRDVLIVSNRAAYPTLEALLAEKGGSSDLADRHAFAARAFMDTAAYDRAISGYFLQSEHGSEVFETSASPAMNLRYGENPHQSASWYGQLEDTIRPFHGKALSYNNLVDVEAALLLISEFHEADPTTIIIKHTNACGVATRDTLLRSWEAALAGDPVSAFGGVIAMNREVDDHTAKAVDALFYEVLLAPAFSQEARVRLTEKKSRILIEYPGPYRPDRQFRSLLNGVLVQNADIQREVNSDLRVVTERTPTEEEVQDMLFAGICVKHLKSNAIALVKNSQLLGMGCGQTSRVDALRQAIAKAGVFGLDLRGAVMASDAFFPFPDCVEIANQAGIKAVIQPGGSVRDEDSIHYCNAHGMAMVLTGYRHFRH